MYFLSLTCIAHHSASPCPHHSVSNKRAAACVLCSVLISIPKNELLSVIKNEVNLSQTEYSCCCSRFCCSNRCIINGMSSYYGGLVGLLFMTQTVCRTQNSPRSGASIMESDDRFHSPTVTGRWALDTPCIMKRYHRRRTCSHTSHRRSSTMVTLHDTRFVECRW